MIRRSCPDTILVGLDVGTTKICVAVAEVKRGELALRGINISPSSGMRKGVVVDMEETVLSIRNALKATEDSFGLEINSVCISVSGAHVKGFHSAGAGGIGGREITCADIERVLESAKDIYMPLDRELLHLMPAGYAVDGQNGIKDPSGMRGEKLEAKVYAVSGAAAPVQNLLRCCEKAGVEVADMVFAPLASAGCILTEDERDHGVALVDIGGGTTDILLYKDGWPRHASVLAVGGNHFTNDIAVGLMVPVSEAERIKRSSGALSVSMVNDAEKVEIVHGAQKREISRRQVAEILQARTDEFLDLVRGELVSAALPDAVSTGVVITGGGALLKGIEKMAESAWGLPVRLGRFVKINGADQIEDNPAYSTGAGLVIYSFEGLSGKFSARDAAGIFGKMKDWTKGLFKIRKGGMEYVRN